MNAILILWKTTERNYGSLTDADFQIKASNFDFPSIDPNFNQALPDPNEELLIMANIVSESVPDTRVYEPIINAVPTNHKNSFYVNVNEFQTSTHYDFKSLPKLVDSIKQREKEANTKVSIESDFAKLSMVNAPIMAKYGTAALTPTEQAIYDRTMEVQSRIIDNDTNARRLIDIATFNSTAIDADKQVFDINSGWKEDGITPLDIPFNDLSA